MAAASGRFVPKNPQKYVGNSSRIMFRSSWELAFFKWLDQTVAVERWGSEELYIPYLHPGDGRVHRYFPDVVVLYRDKSNALIKEIIEIKPYKESVATQRMSEEDKRRLLVNQAKWQAAEKYATANGAKFRVLTERQLFYSGKQLNKKKLGTAV